MVANDALPLIEANPETYEMRANGELLTCEHARELPLAQRYFLFRLSPSSPAMHGSHGRIAPALIAVTGRCAYLGARDGKRNSRTSE